MSDNLFVLLAISKASVVGFVFLWFFFLPFGPHTGCNPGHIRPAFWTLGFFWRRIRSRKCFNMSSLWFCFIFGRLPWFSFGSIVQGVITVWFLFFSFLPFYFFLWHIYVWRWLTWNDPVLFWFSKAKKKKEKYPGQRWNIMHILFSFFFLSILVDITIWRGLFWVDDTIPWVGVFLTRISRSATCG